MDKAIQEKREEIIRRHREVFESTTPEQRKADFEYIINFFKDINPLNFDEIKREGILNK